MKAEVLNYVPKFDATVKMTTFKVKTGLASLEDMVKFDYDPSYANKCICISLTGDISMDYPVGYKVSISPFLMLFSPCLELGADPTSPL